MRVNTQNAEFIRSAAKISDCPRDRLPQIAFAGRSNVGKSSVINRILNRKNLARVGSAPGKTTHINYFLIDKKVYLVDLPGYGFAKHKGYPTPAHKLAVYEFGPCPEHRKSFLSFLERDRARLEAKLAEKKTAEG